MIGMYADADATKWCKANRDVDRKGCTSDATCLEEGRKQCDQDPQCFGVSWYSKNTRQALKLCTEPDMAPKTDGWRTMMKTDGWRLPVPLHLN